MAAESVYQIVAEEVFTSDRDDGVDVLVDLSGHTGFNLMPVFALKPAPVRLTWLYRTTTGVAAIDYHVTDSSVDPPAESNAGYIEAAMRIVLTGGSTGSARCGANLAPHL